MAHLLSPLWKFRSKVVRVGVSRETRSDISRLGEGVLAGQDCSLPIAGPTMGVARVGGVEAPIICKEAESSRVRNSGWLRAFTGTLLIITAECIKSIDLNCWGDTHLRKSPITLRLRASWVPNWAKSGLWIAEDQKYQLGKTHGFDSVHDFNADTYSFFKPPTGAQHTSHNISLDRTIPRYGHKVYWD